jgi:uncharacterized protein involved in exopolysaccharide biosynthesis
MTEHQVRKHADDEIDLRELFIVVWRGKWLVIGITLIFAIISVLYALSLPNRYKSDVLLAPAQSETRAGGLSGQLGGLAALAGVGSASSVSKVDLALEILKSRNFLQRFISKRELLPYLFAVQEWNEATGELIFNQAIYNQTTAEWLVDTETGKGEPTAQEAHKAFMNALTIVQSKESPLVTLSVTHASPHIAQQWLDWLVKDLNLEMRERDFAEADTSIRYLESEIARTNLADAQRVLYQLMEEQVKAKMFTQIRDEYVFKIIDPAIVPEQRHSPKRALICLVITFLGGMFSVLLVLLINAFRK